jgi:hypothetical protein
VGSSASGYQYASVLISSPLGGVLLVKAIGFFSGLSFDPWIYITAGLIGHVFSLVYVIKTLK